MLTRRVSISLFGLIALSYVMLMAQEVNAAPNEVKVTELAPGVFFRKAQTEPRFTGCNQGWVIFRDFVLLIDANFPGQAEEVIATIRKHTDKPIRFVFDTHYHGDHADGNPQYVKQGATIIAQERSQPLFQTKGLEGFTRSQQDAERKDEYGPLTYAIPSLYFSHKLVFDDGSQHVELLFLGHAHTAGDAVAWVPKHGILFTGDACVNGAFNYTGDSNTESWIAVLNAMEELGVQHVAPGHGELAGPELLANQRRYFSELRSAVSAAIAAKKSLDQIKQDIDIPFYKQWTGVDAKSRTENIEHVYHELNGKTAPLSAHPPFQKWLQARSPHHYEPAQVWHRQDLHHLDQQYSNLADLYLASDSRFRKGMRDYFADRKGDLADITFFIRRSSQKIESAHDVEWVRRGLAAAAIEGGRIDPQETTKALALLRYGTERARIGFDPLYRQIQQPEYIAPENKLLFEGVRTMDPRTVLQVVIHEGPPKWAVAGDL